MAAQQQQQYMHEYSLSVRERNYSAGAAFRMRTSAVQRRAVHCGSVGGGTPPANALWDLNDDCSAVTQCSDVLKDDLYVVLMLSNHRCYGVLATHKLLCVRSCVVVVDRVLSLLTLVTARRLVTSLGTEAQPEH
eukprot:18927-Heterococcus_DN1.PRE.1